MELDLVGCLEMVLLLLVRLLVDELGFLSIALLVEELVFLSPEFVAVLRLLLIVVGLVLLLYLLLFVL